MPAILQAALLAQLMKIEAGGKKRNPFKYSTRHKQAEPYKDPSFNISFKNKSGRKVLEKTHMDSLILICGEDMPSTGGVTKQNQFLITFIALDQRA